MQNQDERPRYTDPGRPYSGSGSRYENQYTTGKSGAEDKPFQFPWWAIVLPLVLGMWPVSIVFLVLNKLMKDGKLGTVEQNFHEKTVHFVRRTENRTTNVFEGEFRPIGEDEPAKTTADTANKSGPVYTQAAPPAQSAEAPRRGEKKSGAALALTVAGIVLLATALLALPDGIYWLPDALTDGGYYWRWLLEDSMPALLALAGGAGCLFGAHKLRTGRRLRKKIVNIVGDAQYMYIEDIAASIPCSYEKCCKHLENCIDAGMFGPEAFLDRKRRCLVVKGKAPEKNPVQTPAKAQTAQAAGVQETEQTKDQYQKILDELRRVNDAIPDEEMSDKISRLEAVSAKIFEQVKADPEKLPRMRKFMDYYLPTSLKLLQAYAELDAQGVEGENITESKRRIEQTMDTLVQAFENQLDQLFAADALDISADIDVMQNMLRADGLTGEPPFKP